MVNETNTMTRLDRIRRMLTPADWLEVDSIAESRDVRERYLFLYQDDPVRAMNLAVAIYYRRMRRHDARFQNLFD